jgi:glycosyltransferase involved in cell wall biosynthesis
VRCALVGAFTFPHPQGSQVYAELQARALLDEGVDVTFVRYGGPPTSLCTEDIPQALRPGSARSGPQWKKPVADAALVARLVSLLRREAFDAVLAHNAEAAAAALVARLVTGVPVVYIAHTLLRFELSAYAPPAAARWLDAFGALVDRSLARHADAVVALCGDARERFAPFARGPLAVIPPALEPRAAPSSETIRRACAKAGVVPGRFTLYAGNLDGYQELDLLAAAARTLADPERPVLVASHDPRVAQLAAPGRGLVGYQVEDFAQMRALTFAAGELVLCRRRRGGFPVKLLNYMESGRPLVAFSGVAEGLEDGRSAWLLPTGAGPLELADAIRRLQSDPEHGRTLGRAARAVLLRRHAPKTASRQTLDLLARVVARPRRTRVGQIPG